MNATSYTPTSITVCFKFPEGSTQNGLITSFNVTLDGYPFNTESQTISIPITSTVYPLTGSMCGDVTNLEEYNEYNISSIVLVNSAGVGPSSPSIKVQTLETGNIPNCLILSILNVAYYVICHLSCTRASLRHHKRAQRARFLLN